MDPSLKFSKKNNLRTVPHISGAYIPNEYKVISMKIWFKDNIFALDLVIRINPFVSKIQYWYLVKCFFMPTYFDFFAETREQIHEGGYENAASTGL